FYSLMVDYSQSTGYSQDANHKDRLFNYGYVGKFTTYREPSYTFRQVTDEDGNVTDAYYEHDGFRDYRVDFEASETNDAFAAITRQYYDIYDGKVTGNYENLFQIQTGKALRNGDTPEDVYEIWNNFGVPYNFYQKFENNQFRATGSGSINIGGH